MTIDEITALYESIEYVDGIQSKNVTAEQLKARDYLNQYWTYMENKKLFIKLVEKKVEELEEKDLVILFNPIPSWDEFKHEVRYYGDFHPMTNHDWFECRMGAWTTNFTYVMHRYDGPEEVVPIRRDPSREFLIPNLGGG